MDGVSQRSCPASILKLLTHVRTVPAVRLDDVRDQVIQACAQQGSYSKSLMYKVSLNLG